MYLIPQAAITGSPISPTPKSVRTTVAAVFNRDISDDDSLSEAEAVIVLASKVLQDIGYEAEATQTLFRNFKAVIGDWCERMRLGVASKVGNRFVQRPSPILLTITDNRSAAIVGGNFSTRYYDFIDAKEIIVPKTVSPLLQVGLSLLRLFELSVGIPKSDWYPLAAAEAIEAAKQVGQTSD